MIFLDPAQRLSSEAELAQYQLHENNPHDPRYVSHLEKLWLPVRELLSPPAHGLDYGSGPTPVLAQLIERDGYTVTCFDPYFAPGTNAFATTYDFIVCSETAEHFYEPRKEFARLCSLIAPSGILGVMTQLIPSLEGFANWHYNREPTHVAFYGEDTMQWIANQWSLGIIHLSSSVTIFKKFASTP